jgi:toxin ParE1/3/4
VSRELVFTPAALTDLEETFWFIAADNPRRARSYVAEIEQACRNLCETPLMAVKGRICGRTCLSSRFGDVF